MRRAIIATAGTAAALVAVLSYKSSNAVKASKVAVNPVPSAVTTVPSSSSSSTTFPGATPTTSPGSSSPTFVPSSTSVPSSSSTAASGPQAFTGTDVHYNYGEIQLRITTVAGKITKIDVARESAPDGRSESINSQAIPILLKESLAAQGVNIDVVSGATFTTQAFAQALQSALDQAGK
jgi:uncharacterized protein with FMN-binding domain